MKPLPATLALACLMLAACGGSSSHPSSGASTAPPQRQGFAATPPATGPLADRLTQALLTVPDLPAAWRLSKEAPRAAPEDTTICNANLADIEGQRQKLAEVSVSFDQGASGPYLTQTIAAYPEGGAQRAMNDLRAAVQGCSEVVVRDEEGTLSTWQLTLLPFPQLGDETIALKEFLPVNRVEAVIVYIRRGDALTVLVHIVVGGSVDTAQTERFARRADEKLAQVGSIR